MSPPAFPAATAAPAEPTAPANMPISCFVLIDPSACAYIVVMNESTLILAACNAAWRLSFVTVTSSSASSKQQYAIALFASSPVKYFPFPDGFNEVGY